jgi:thiol-disulfide isomerase/thioredoxin
MKSESRKDINLFCVEDGELKMIATTPLGEDGSFGFLFTPPEEGFYAVGYSDTKPSSAQYPLYLKKGDKAEVAIEGKQIKYIGKQTPENTVLSSWNKITEELKIKAIYFMEPPLSTYKDFFPVFTSVLPKAEEFRKTIKTKNTRFNELMKDLTYFDMDLYATNFVSTPRKEHPKEEDLIPYYKTIVQKDKYKTDNVLSTIYGKKLLYNYAGRTSKKGNGLLIDSVLTYFNTDRQKGVYAFARMAPFIQSYAGYESLTAKYNQYFQSSPYLSAKVKELGKKLYVSAPGGKGVDFKFADQEGKMVSFSDLKGKLVLVDVWATWCAPCKKEIPFLKELEKEMHDKDITFVSLSVDEKKNEEAWHKMIKDLQLTGIQLFAGSYENNVTAMYEIETIPRFMLFNREGKIITVNAPRPSDPKLKALLLQELKK